MSASTNQRLLTSSDLSDLIGVPIGTLDQWAYKRIGPAFIKCGRHRRYDPADVDAWLASQRRGGRDAA